jgi:hypothetical protein
VSLLGEVGSRCLPFPAKSTPIDDYFGWFEEVKVAPRIVNPV